MSEADDKRYLRSQVVVLGSFCNNKMESRPTTREECDQDRSLNETIRNRALQIRQDKYFKNLIIENKSHEEFLDLWEQLDYFVNKWAYPYRVLNEVEWREEDDDLYGIGKALMYDVKIV